MTTNIQQSNLEWAAGMIDGDGCICLYGTWNALHISVGKAKNGYASLNKMKDLFGGRINKNRNEIGNLQECSSWVIACQDALSFCELIEPYMVLKKKQFTRALDYPLNKMGTALTNDKKELRLAIKDDLKRMKKEPDEPIEKQLSDAYYAGFFDSEGTVEAIGFNQIRLSAPQKYRAICDALKDRYGGSVTVPRVGMYSWRLSNIDECMEVLRAIQPYSVEKLPQIELVLNMKTNEATIVNRELKQYKGNQLGKSASDDKDDKKPQKRLHDLPRYISFCKNNNENCGYQVQYKGKHKSFVTSKDSMEVKLSKAIKCLEEFKQSEL